MKSKSYATDRKRYFSLKQSKIDRELLDFFDESTVDKTNVYMPTCKSVILPKCMMIKSFDKRTRNTI